jgi:hypothetical protein
MLTGDSICKTIAALTHDAVVLLHQHRQQQALTGKQ